MLFCLFLKPLWKQNNLSETGDWDVVIDIFNIRRFTLAPSGCNWVIHEETDAVDWYFRASGACLRPPAWVSQISHPFFSATPTWVSRTHRHWVYYQYICWKFYDVVGVWKHNGGITTGVHIYMYIYHHLMPMLQVEPAGFTPDTVIGRLMPLGTGTLHVTYIAEDAEGNFATCTFLIRTRGT